MSVEQDMHEVKDDEDEFGPEFLEGSSSGSEFETDNGSDESESIADEDADGDEAEDDLDGLGEGGLVETQIEVDFDRLVGEIRTADDVASSAMLSKLWDTPLAEGDAEEQFHADLRAASGIGKGKGRGRGRGRRQGPALSHQVRALIGEGNTAYVDGDTAGALRIMTEVLRIEPRARAAWTVLAACHRERGEPRRALQLAIMGAHLAHDADEWATLARESRAEGLAQQALYCYAKATRLAPADCALLWDRAALAQDTGDLRAARNAYLALLKRLPHDTTVLTALRHVLIELGDLRLCAELYQDTFTHFTALPPSGVIDPALSDTVDASEGVDFGFMELLVLADLYNSLGWYARAIKTIRAGCRWLQGRAKQKYWDACADDREYDPEGSVREHTPEGEGGLAIAQGFYPLDINARHRLAVARLKVGDIDEGRMHASVVLSQSAADYSPLFAEIADAFFERTMYAEARPVYEMLGADATTSSIHVLMQAAECRRNLGDTRDAAEVYEHIIVTDPTNSEAKMKLAEILEVTGQPRRALELVYQVMDARRKQRTGTSPSLAEDDSLGTGIPEPALFAEKRKGAKAKSASVAAGRARQTLSREQLEVLERTKETDAARWYDRCAQTRDAMRAGDPLMESDWLLHAEKLIEMFRETRNIFPSRSARLFTGMFRAKRTTMAGVAEKKSPEAEEKMASRLELELGEESAPVDRKEVFHFRGIQFSEWLALAMEYAFLLTRRDQFEAAEDVLRHLLLSLVYRAQGYQDTLRLALTSECPSSRPHPVLTSLAYPPFNNEPVRVLFAALASGLAQTDQVIDTRFQKFALREMRIGVAAVTGTSAVERASVDPDLDPEEQNEIDADPDAEDSVPAGLEKAAIPGLRETGMRPTKYNPVMPTLYGQSLIMAKSYQGGLFYLLHAYDYFPTDPLICLTLAVASLGRAMQRQSDNRNYLITQAMGFMTKYRALRTTNEDDPLADEIEYNYGRAFHQLGLFSHAITHYERVLAIVDKRQKAIGEQDENIYGIAREAAHNLSLIYVTTGATSLAQTVYRRWLSI
ncbi:TPR-like protein [Phellopilus nigrolimitatus]|nr:TPR-like protein [Phellopilus nigrolimitatus]